MKNTFILHGTAADLEANWFSWLKKNLEKSEELSARLIVSPGENHFSHKLSPRYRQLPELIGILDLGEKV